MLNTDTGTLELAVPPFPSRPSAPDPQHCTPPPDNTAHVLNPPALTFPAVCPVLNAVNDRKRSAVSFNSEELLLFNAEMTGLEALVQPRSHLRNHSHRYKLQSRYLEKSTASASAHPTAAVELGVGRVPARSSVWFRRCPASSFAVSTSRRKQEAACSQHHQTLSA